MHYILLIRSLDYLLLTESTYLYVDSARRSLRAHLHGCIQLIIELAEHPMADQSPNREKNRVQRNMEGNRGTRAGKCGRRFEQERSTCVLVTACAHLKTDSKKIWTPMAGNVAARGSYFTVASRPCWQSSRAWRQR